MSEESISPEELDEIIDGYIEEEKISGEDPVSEQIKKTIPQITSSIFSTIIVFFELIHVIACIISKEIKKELISTEPNPDRGFAWECIRQTVWLFAVGLLSTVGYFTLQLMPGGPPNATIEYIMEMFLWSYYLVIILIQSTRYTIYEFQKLRQRDTDSSQTSQ